MHNLKVILNFSVETSITRFLQNNLANIKLFFALFATTLLIYGQKLFFCVLATDDFTRYYGGGAVEQSSLFGRWMTAIINKNIFTGALHILPYFNGVIGVFSFTLAGFLTAKFLKRNNVFDICIITLLISVTPFVAHNLYFNTNISTWITTLFGVVGLLMAYKPNKFTKLFGFVLLVISIGAYQTIVQVVIAMIIIKAILETLQAKNQTELWKIILNTALYIAFVLLAFIASSFINHLYMEYYNLSVKGRYKNAGAVLGLYEYFERIIGMFKVNIHPLYFKDTFKTLYALITLSSIIGLTTIVVFKSERNLRIKITSLVVIGLLFLSIPIIINLPKITGNGIPLRAHYTIGWFLAGFFIIQMSLFSGIFKTFVRAIAISIIMVSAFYINVYFEAGARQTSADILRANQIVERIRNHENYTTEPIKYKIVGTKSFPVIGWKSSQQGLNKGWSKYALFKKFTDLKFSKMSNEEYKKIEEALVKRGVKINTYPNKDSIFVYGNKAIIYLSNKK